VQKILIIEDEELILESINEFLVSEGYECITALNGIDGVKKAKEKKPDLILCDVNMPGLDGHQVLQYLRANPLTSTVPFIFLSAMVHKNDLRRGMILGADDYITKPFQPEELLKSVQTRLEKHSALQKKIEVLKESISMALPHELQTPLVAIIGYAEMLNEKFTESPDAEAKEFSEGILQAGLRLKRLIQNFIFYEKLVLIEEDPQLADLKDTTCEVSADLITSLVNKVKQRFSRDDDLTINVEEAIVKLPMTFLHNLVEELVDNAFKFSSPGTPVTVSCKKEKKYYNICVTDKGRGMTADQIANVSAYLQFERDKYEQQGMGLGLTIAKKIVDIFGGKLEINSFYGEMTEVSVSLPLSSEK
jgi:DNA-binding response OmpR family regulator